MIDVRTWKVVTNPGFFQIDDPTLKVVIEYVATTISGMIAGMFFDELVCVCA